MHGCEDALALVQVTTHGGHTEQPDKDQKSRQMFWEKDQDIATHDRSKKDQDWSIDSEERLANLSAVQALAACQLGFQWMATRTQYEQGAVLASKQLEAQPIKVLPESRFCPCQQQLFSWQEPLLDIDSQFQSQMWKCPFFEHRFLLSL